MCKSLYRSQSDIYLQNLDKTFQLMQFGIFMVVTMNITVIKDVLACSPVHIYQHSSEISLNLADFMSSHFRRQ
jgi:hypothetical protein